MARDPVFEDVSATVGLAHVHRNGMSGERWFVEMMGAGVALFDYDGDGDLDLYLVQGGGLDGSANAVEPEQGDRLYRNELRIGARGERHLRFRDVTAESGIVATGYGMGVAAADYDGDGRVDLYVTNWGPNQLWRNRGDGTFEERALAAGVEVPAWSVAAVFFDFDRDGHLDLFVGNYVEWSLATHRRCTSQLGIEDYCGPLAFEPAPDALFKGRAGGRFDDVTGGAGLAEARGAALGALAADLDGDGWPDLYVANDQMPNHLWRNRAGMGFQDEALLAGCAVNGEGRPEASMGVTAADFDLDGDEDLFLTHLMQETHTLYVNEGGGVFRDDSQVSGLGAPSWEFTGFGTGWIDFDNDGLLDLLTVNGAVKLIPEQAAAGDPLPLRQRNQLFRNLGGGRFAQVDLPPGSPLLQEDVSRGAAFGDIDNDGDTDVVITNNNGPARVLLNQLGSRQAWIGLRAVEGDPPRDALGARIGLHRPGQPVAWRRVQTGDGYASASDPRVLFGLGRDTEIEAAEVRWPDGQSELWHGLSPGRYHTLRRGDGR